jgi:hypothetical protein
LTVGQCPKNAINYRITLPFTIIYFANMSMPNYMTIIHHLTVKPRWQVTSVCEYWTTLNASGAYWTWLVKPTYTTLTSVGCCKPWLVPCWEDCLDLRSLKVVYIYKVTIQCFICWEHNLAYLISCYHLSRSRPTEDKAVCWGFEPEGFAWNRAAAARLGIKY